MYTSVKRSDVMQDANAGADANLGCNLQRMRILPALSRYVHWRTIIIDEPCINFDFGVVQQDVSPLICSFHLPVFIQLMLYPSLFHFVYTADSLTQMSCNFTSRSELLPFEQDPKANLTSLITNCDDVCLLTLGSGNPDLAGVGVREFESLPDQMIKLWSSLSDYNFLYLPIGAWNPIRARHLHGHVPILPLPTRSQYQPLHRLAQPTPRNLSLVSAFFRNSDFPCKLHTTDAGIMFYLRNFYNNAFSRSQHYQLFSDAEFVLFFYPADGSFCPLCRRYLCLYNRGWVSAPYLPAAVYEGSPDMQRCGEGQEWVMVERFGPTIHQKRCISTIVHNWGPSPCPHGSVVIPVPPTRRVGGDLWRKWRPKRRDPSIQNQSCTVANRYLF